MKRTLFFGLACIATAMQSSAQVLWEDTHDWSEFPQAQAEAYETGKAERTAPLDQQGILFCKAHWEGFSEAIEERGADIVFGALTADEVFSAVDHWAARLEISDYDAERAISDKAYYSLFRFGPSADIRLAATKKLGACAPAD